MRVCVPRGPDDHLPQLADHRAVIVRVDRQPRQGAVRVDETRPASKPHERDSSGLSRANQ